MQGSAASTLENWHQVGPCRRPLPWEEPCSQFSVLETPGWEPTVPLPPREEVGSQAARRGTLLQDVCQITDTVSRPAATFQRAQRNEVLGHRSGRQAGFPGDAGADERESRDQALQARPGPRHRCQASLRLVPPHKGQSC